MSIQTECPEEPNLETMAKILVIRFSDLGDVARTIPMVYSLAVRCPQHQITVLSKDDFAPLFERMPDNVLFRGIDLRGEYAGLMGLGWLYRDLKEEQFDAVADLQDSLRSRYLRWRFRMNGATTAYRSRKSDKDYADVLQEAGFEVCPVFVSLFGNGKGDIRSLHPLTGSKGTDRWIGIAPFPPHTGKPRLTDEQKEEMEQLAARLQGKLLLFGNGRKEAALLEKWAKKLPNAICMAGKLTMRTELALMSHLDEMWCANPVYMQLAALVNVPCYAMETKTQAAQ